MNINLETITDIKELKALAFDQIQTLEVAQANLRAIQQRIAQIGENVPSEPDSVEPTEQS